MSLTAIMNSGVTGMLAHQQALNVTSNNIANVQTEGYARKVVDYSTIVLGGQGAGVDIEDVRRVTDEFIQRELRLSTASTEQYAAMSDIYGKLQALLGDPAENTSLTGKVDSIHTSLSQLTVDPTLSVARSSALTEIQNFAIEANRLQTQIQALRKEADNHIVTEIETVNRAILRIHELNQEISSATISGKPTGELEDKRDQALSEIADIVDVKTYPQGNNSVAVITNAGQQLLDFIPRQLVYDAAATVTSETIFDQVTINVYNTTTETVAATGLALDPELTGGSLRGWLDMRNVELPGMANQIGALAGEMAEQLNAVHNANVAVPPPATLTGHNSGVVATDDHGFTGQATFYSFDTNNDIVASYTVDFDAGGTTTMADVLAEVNGALGAGTLTLTNGVLEMTAQGGATGVGVQQVDTDPSLRGGKGFSHFFGLNDLVEASVPTNFDTGLAAGDAHGFTGTIDIENRGPNGEVQSSFTIDFGAIGGTVNDIINELNTNLSPAATASLTSDGAIVISNVTGYENYSINVSNDTSDRGATGVSFADMFGVGLRYPVDQSSGLTVRSDILASPMSMALARVDATGTPALNLSDNRGALSFQDLANTATSFDTWGGLPGSNVTVGEYAAQILAKSGLDAARADSLREDRAALAGVLEEKLLESAGVNMDEELANLIVYQNAYNAAARVITTARDMYDILINIV
ncbi:flagellar hook-associated protein FlgK [Sneathiella limimaris]|uniref:flagellar hook-associated protein FlgK n=1 Tax=Sneathiella limimaris TaxID=1964213 RepID=UPI00146F5AC2|nr:flagellar hook-associated protein FlgK [Sneathiella limimaris]